MNSHCLDFEGRLSLHPNGSKLRSHACWALGKSLPAAAGLVHILPGCIMLGFPGGFAVSRNEFAKGYIC